LFGQVVVLAGPNVPFVDKRAISKRKYEKERQDYRRQVTDPETCLFAAVRDGAGRGKELKGKETILSEPDSDLTDNEGTLLALVLREQPITAYQIAKRYEQSPVSNFNTSKGKIYPLIRRLRDRGLLAAQAVKGDLRGTERLVCTDAGRQIIRAWTRQVRPTHLLLEDPLRTKIQSFDLLSREEQIQWVVDAKALLTEKLREVHVYSDQVDVPYKNLVRDNAVASLRARLDWLDRVLQQIVRGADAA
jgi:DNA-binding PadR family transcriptional regulator